MAIRKVKWFNASKGSSFIVPEGGGKDLFVHISAVERAGLSTLPEGAKVSYEAAPSVDGNLRGVDGSRSMDQGFSDARREEAPPDPRKLMSKMASRSNTG